VIDFLYVFASHLSSLSTVRNRQALPDASASLHGLQCHTSAYVGWQFIAFSLFLASSLSSLC
jgi:hypothetical protein